MIYLLYVFRTKWIKNSLSLETFRACALCGFDFDIMNKIVADGVDRHLVNVEERRIMIDKKYYEKAARYVGTRF